MDGGGHDRPLSSELGDIARRSEHLVTSMQAFFRRYDRSLADEFKTIADYIARTRDEISALAPRNLSEERIPSAGAELDAIVRDTGEATHRIMTAAEALLAEQPADPAEAQAFVSEKAIEILEACGFHDLTGQRISKVVQTLKLVEGRISRLAATLGVPDEAPPTTLSAEDQRARDLMLNGPAINGPETDQAAIDAMFGEAAPAAAAESDQAGIDALFGEAATEAKSETDQAGIDAMFGDAGGEASQADIDALFD